MEPTRAQCPSWALRSSAVSNWPLHARSALLLAVALAVTACGETTSVDATATPTPTSDLAQSYVAIGDSFTAGMVSNSLVETHQAYSFPAQIARQAATEEFQQPLVSTPGIEVELELKRFYQGPISIAPRAGVRGSAINGTLTRPFNNLGVPGAKMADLLTATGTASSYHGLVLRSFGTALTQAKLESPSLVTLWIGNSDALPAIIGGRAVDGTTLTPATQFEAAFTQAVKTLLTDTDASLVVANIPDLTKVPFATTFKPYVVDATTGEPKLQDGQRIPLIGPRGTALASSALVTLAASPLLANGDGIPVSAGGRGTSLPDEVILDLNEVDIIRERIDAYNLTIRKVCVESAVPVVDMHALFEQFSSTGVVVGGARLDSAFLTGGLFSYDGVHLTDLGYAVVANEWIRTINQNGGAIPLVNLAPIMGFRGGAALTMTPAPVPSFAFSQEAYTALLRIYGGTH
jgi:hypothetical protein